MAASISSFEKQKFVIDGYQGHRLNFYDRTGGKVKISYSEEKSIEMRVSTYYIEVNGVKATFPEKSAYRPQYACITGSKKISVKIVDGMIRMKEVEASKTRNKFYLDSEPVNGVLNVFSHRPKELTREQAVKILEQLKEIPDFKGDMPVYNRHGVGVFGYFKGRAEYAFYWANPEDQKLTKVEKCGALRARDGGSSRANLISNEMIVDFSYLFSEQKYYLNGEEAERIRLDGDEVKAY